MRLLAGHRVQSSIVLPVDTQMAVLAAGSVLASEHPPLDVVVNNTSLSFVVPLIL
jgi:hypothetical protein